MWFMKADIWRKTMLPMVGEGNYLPWDCTNEGQLVNKQRNGPDCKCLSCMKKHEQAAMSLDISPLMIRIAEW